MRTFGESCELLVASPGYLDQVSRPDEPARLGELATLSFDSEAERQTWEMRGPGDRVARIEIAPRVICHDFAVLRAGVLAGLGVARLPESVVRDDVAAGRLERVLPQWSTPQGIVHLVFPTRRGLLPAVRAFIDFLAARLPAAI